MNQQRQDAIISSTSTALLSQTPPIPFTKLTPTLDVHVNIEQHRRFWETRRSALLLEVDAIERALSIEPRTASLRKKQKAIDTN